MSISDLGGSNGLQPTMFGLGRTCGVPASSDPSFLKDASDRFLPHLVGDIRIFILFNSFPTTGPDTAYKEAATRENEREQNGRASVRT